MMKNGLISPQDTDDCLDQKQSAPMPVALLNGPIATTNGLYRISDISLEKARELIVQNSFFSAIGHAATAEILSELFGVPVQMNRIEFRQQIGQKAIVFKLNQRSPEGCILSKEEIEKIGYTFKLMERLE